MTGVRDFVAGLARAGKSFDEIKETTDLAFGDKSLHKSTIYRIINKVKTGKNTDDQRHLNAKKTRRTQDLIAAVAATIDKDARVTVQYLARANQVSVSTIFAVLHDDLGLVKKSVRWVPKLLSMEQKEERVRICSKFTATIRRESKAFLNRIVTMDENMVSFHTPETKRMSKQWIKKGQPGLVKARVHASRTKQMVLAFFDADGLIYTRMVQKGKSVNAAFIVDTLATFLKNLKQKRPQLVEQGWMFHWDNAPVHTAAVVQKWLSEHKIQMLEHPPYSPDLAPADYFLFPRVKELLAGRRLTQETIKTTWEGVLRLVSKDEFATAFQRWYERCDKCIRIGGNYVEKS